MMAYFPSLRRRVARLICPELGCEALSQLSGFFEHSAIGGVRFLDKTTGALTLRGNRFHAEWMKDYAGEKVVARYIDPMFRGAGVEVYSMGGGLMGEARLCEERAFFVSDPRSPRDDLSREEALFAVRAEPTRLDVFMRDDEGGFYVGVELLLIVDHDSGKILSWIASSRPNGSELLQAFWAVAMQYGKPDCILFDNGLASTSKWILGQPASEDLAGAKALDVIERLKENGVSVNWMPVVPFSGSRKPWERVIRYLIDRIARRPEIAPAYFGNRPGFTMSYNGGPTVSSEQVRVAINEAVRGFNRWNETAPGGGA